MTADKWDARMLSLAAHIAEWSKDPSSHVGAVIVDSRHRVISLGYNGPPRGVEDTPDMPRDVRLECTIHAEENALLFANVATDGCSMYVTHHPCSRCAIKIIQSGIVRVAYTNGDREFSARWQASIDHARRLFAMAGVECTGVVL